jgi:hypothetical protein
LGVVGTRELLYSSSFSSASASFNFVDVVPEYFYSLDDDDDDDDPHVPLRVLTRVLMPKTHN